MSGDIAIRDATEADLPAILDIYNHEVRTGTATFDVEPRTLDQQRVWLARVGGVLIIVFGLYLLGVLNITAFMRERRVHLADKPMGYLGTVLVGIAFGAGWSPCIGPILGAILTYTASEADLQRGMVLLLSYSMGLAIPFIAAALAVDWFLTAFTKFRKYLGYVQKVAGVLLIAVGILMVTNYFTILATALQALTPEFLRSRI